jgi:hypothetical protein
LLTLYRLRLQLACTNMPASTAVACALLALACLQLEACSLLAPAWWHLQPAACSLLAAAALKGAHLTGQADKGPWAHAGVVAALLLAGDALQDAVCQHITPTTQTIF